MQSATHEYAVNKRTTDSLRAAACSAAAKLRDGIARMIDDEQNTDADASSDLISLCGNLDQLDSVVRHAIGTHARPIPADLIELHARIDACVDAAMDLAGWAFDNGSARANSASRAFVKVQNLLAFVDPACRRRARFDHPAAGLDR
jgi:hypothetical protein